MLSEFFAQGDRERDLGLNISPLCDRNTVVFSKSQIGFIDMFILPIFSVFREIIPEFQECENNINENRKKLKKMADEGTQE